MIRPLVWVGIAYVTGEGLAASGIRPWVLCALSGLYTACLSAGRRHFSTLLCRMMYVLPAFVVFGYLMYLFAAFPAGAGLCDDGSRYVRFQGRVVSVQEKEKSTALQIRDARLEANGKSIGGSFGVILFASPQTVEDEKIEAGCTISGKGTMDVPESATNPGQFDMKTWYLAQGVQYMIRPDALRLEHRSLGCRAILARLRRLIADVFSRLFPGDITGILDAMILGDRRLLDEDIRDLFRIMGVSHILAISGLHISLIGQSLYGVLRRIGVPVRPAALVSSFAVLNYGVLSGMGASTSRAVIMFLIAMGARFFGRSYDMLSALAFSALIIFIRQPLMITQSGVQFSFSAILALGVLWPAMQRLIPKKAEEDEQERTKAEAANAGRKACLAQALLCARLLSSLGPAAAVTILTLPLTAVYYGELPLLSLPVNLLVIPAMSLVVQLGLLTGLIGLISVRLAALTGGSVAFLLSFFIRVFEKTATLPFASLRTGMPSAVMLVSFYALLTAFVIGSSAAAGEVPGFCMMAGGVLRFLAEKISDFSSAARIRSYLGKSGPHPHGSSKNQGIPHARELTYLLLTAVLLLIIPFRRLENVTMMLNVGQGDCTFLRSCGVSWMIDGGSSDVKKVGEYRLAPVLDYYGEDRLDYALVSHGDEDHLSGIRELLKMRRVRHLILTVPGRKDDTLCSLAKLARKNGADVRYISAGARWVSGRLRFQCLYPPAEMNAEDTNDTSMLLRIDSGDLSILTTGDISSAAEDAILQTYGSMRKANPFRNIDVLKCAHHGSKYSSTTEFLKLTSPALTIISCGRFNRYGHPSKEAVARIKASGSEIAYTMEDGALWVRKRKGRVAVKAYREH